MNNNNAKNNTRTTPATGKTICKLGLDCHAASIVVARQWEGQTPPPPQRFAVGKFLGWVAAQLEQGYQIISCYEAGPTGY